MPLLAGMYILPTEGFGLGSARVFMIGLIFLSPLFVFGIDTISKGIIRLFRIEWKTHYLTIASIIILTPYILFNSGVIFELTKSTKIDSIDVPFSSSLSGYRLDITTYFSENEVAAMKWLMENRDKSYPIMGDIHSGLLALQFVPDYGKFYDIVSFCDNKYGYVFLRERNVQSGTLTIGTMYGCRRSMPWSEYYNSCKPMVDILNKGVVIFDNGAKIIKVDKHE